mmetsp:Transcript_39309/g.93029  ORF Transcript_39309/g.93029 Transcript_39309/m.93029 type:complete len:264 (-) Transcript_39309:784-1575(-)
MTSIADVDTIRKSSLFQPDLMYVEKVWSMTLTQNSSVKIEFSTRSTTLSTARSGELSPMSGRSTTKHTHDTPIAKSTSWSRILDCAIDRHSTRRGFLSPNTQQVRGRLSCCSALKILNDSARLIWMAWIRPVSRVMVIPCFSSVFVLLAITGRSAFPPAVSVEESLDISRVIKALGSWATGAAASSAAIITLRDSSRSCMIMQKNSEKSIAPLLSESYWFTRSISSRCPSSTPISRSASRNSYLSISPSPDLSYESNRSSALE